MANGFLSNSSDDQQRPGVGVGAGAPSPNTGLPTPGVNGPNRRRNGGPGVRPGGATGIRPGVGRSGSQRFLPAPQVGANIGPGANPAFSANRARAAGAQQGEGQGQDRSEFGEDRTRPRRNPDRSDLNQNAPPSAGAFGARPAKQSSVGSRGVTGKFSPGALSRLRLR